MQAQFINGFTTSIAGMIDERTLAIINEQLSMYVCDYEITKRSTELVLYNYFPDCAKDYLATRKVEGLSQNSINSYYYRLKDFFDTLKMPIENIRKEDIIRYLYRMNVKDQTKANALTIIKTFFTWCVNEDYLTKNPCKNIRPIKYERRQPEFLTDMEIEKLRNACQTKREKAMVEFFYSTGCRISEAMGANITDIDFQSGELTLLGKGNKYRKAYLNPKSQIAILEYLEERTDKGNALFVSQRRPYKRITSKSTMEDDFEKIGIRAGIQKHVHPHLLRHSNATTALRNGMPIEEVQKILGHVDINTTLIYATVSDDSVKRSHRRCVS